MQSTQIQAFWTLRCEQISCESGESGVWDRRSGVGPDSLHFLTSSLMLLVLGWPTELWVQVNTVLIFLSEVPQQNLPSGKTAFPALHHTMSSILGSVKWEALCSQKGGWSLSKQLCNISLFYERRTSWFSKSQESLGKENCLRIEAMLPSLPPRAPPRPPHKF